jgi:outer membrane protein TolC
VTRALVALGVLLASVPVAAQGAGGGAAAVTLRDCVLGALERNPAIRARRLDVDEARLSVKEAQSVFRPTLSGAVGFDRQRTAPWYSFYDASGLYDDSVLKVSADLSWLPPLPTGTRLTVSASSAVDWTSLQSVVLSPRYGNTLQLGLSQPILRGRGRHAGLILVEASRLDVLAMEAEVTQDAMALLMRVVQAYWSLVSQQEELRIGRQSVTLAQRQVELSRARVKKGLVSPLETAEPEAELAARTQELAAAEVGLVRAQTELRTLVFGQPGRPADQAPREVQAVERPRLDAEPRALAELTSAALAQRPELRGLAQRRRAASLRAETAQNALLPQLDFEASVGAASLAGRATCDPGTACPINSALIGGYDLSWQQVFTAKMPYWHVGLRLQTPLGYSAARSQAEKRALDRQRLELKHEEARWRVTTEVQDAYLRHQACVRRLAGAERSVELARLNLEAAEKKLASGLGTTYDALRAQELLARAERARVQAVRDLAGTRAELAVAVGELPLHLGIEIRPAKPR